MSKIIKSPAEETLELLRKGYENLDINELARLEKLFSMNSNLNWDKFLIDQNSDLDPEERTGGRSTCYACQLSLNDSSILDMDYRNFTNPHYVHLPGYTENSNWNDSTTD